MGSKIISPHEILLDGTFSDFGLVSVRLVPAEDQDISIPIESYFNQANNKTAIHLQEAIDPQGHYFLITPRERFDIGPPLISVLFSTILVAALVNNFVFTRYLGLCVFFGVSKKKDTAIGMGVTFTIIALLSGFLSWIIHHFALMPLKLEFMQIITFIGIVACLVQALDTVLKKIQPILHRKFGIYLVLITTNCIILAVPLLNASAHAGFLESMALSLGAGIGFALSLFLMSCVRERVELAPVPQVFRGLPIAFIIAGLFALSFLGFSGMR